METENKIEVELRLSQSEFSDAIVCDDKNLIHQVQMEKILNIFESQYQKAQEYTSSNIPENQKIVHNTISIFANRGAGKTTFLLSALKRIKDKHKNVICLRPIDPSIIDCKQHPFINIIAAIHQIVEESIKESPWERSSIDKKDNLEEYKSIYKKLLKGLPFIDGIGNENIYQNWDDELFISMQGMERAEASNNLIDSFHEYIRKALKLLQKVCFVISFDDIDTNFQKGYELLEVIRKYLTTEQIICILTGDLELYGKLVRKASWQCFDTNFLNKERTYAKRNEEEFSTMINHLENQYLLKILKPEYRIQLHTINEVIEEDNSTIEVFFSENQKKGLNLDDCYIELLKVLNLPTNNQRILTSILLFLRSLSLRSQIRLLCLIKRHISFNENSENISLKNNNSIATALANIFWNDINQKATNAKKLITPSPFYTVEMQSFLLHNQLIPGGSNFMPSTNDETLNKALLTIGALYNIQAEKNSFQIFDFWLRLCYVQYATKTFEGGHNPDIINKFIKFSCLNDNDDLTKCIGLAQAYCQREYNKYYNSSNKTMAGTIIINYIPLLQLNENSIFTTLILEGSLDEMQNETVFASFYKLLAAIRDILFLSKTTNKPQESIINSTSLLLSKLMQYRSYIEPNDLFNKVSTEKYLGTDEQEISFGDYKGNEIKELAKEMLRWDGHSLQNNKPKNVSTQLLQSIFTRSYFTMTNIDKNKRYTNVGEKMNAYIIGFLNAVLVENAIEENYTEVNLNTNGNIEQIYKNNLEALFHNSNNSRLRFYHWISRCPLLIKFINPFIKDIIQNKNIEVSWSLYKYSIKKNYLDNKKEKNRIIKENIRILNDAITWIDKQLSSQRPTNKQEYFLNMYTDNYKNKTLST